RRDKERCTEPRHEGSAHHGARRHRGRRGPRDVGGFPALEQDVWSVSGGRAGADCGRDDAAGGDDAGVSAAGAARDEGESGGRPEGSVTPAGGAMPTTLRRAVRSLRRSPVYFAAATTSLA